ncbi:hypothetical protein QWY82_17305 [Simiduia curdlanivorans]|uniref:ABC transporter permease n=1 Tax=Simiduia curdlanivorans TaxID=1492769 RepID=A0ABV8V4U3_9GAMM|nr:hypothetical protein [Simiduia curdlanivorans]MDN3640558.1 hypothetical protein [Simiduia curdlanivorans]
MNRYLLPFKREFWEYRGSFIRLPFFGAAIIALLMTAALTLYATNVIEYVFEDDDFRFTTSKEFVNGKMHLDIDFNEQEVHREALEAARESLIQARDDLQQHGADFDPEEIEQDLEAARQDLAQAQQALARIGINIDLSNATTGIDHSKIKADVQRQVNREIAKIDQEIAQLERELTNAIIAPPKAPAAPVAPAAPSTPPEAEDIRQFPSQVIVIKGDQALGFSDDNIESINDVIRVFFVIFSGLMMIVGIFYLLSCLYTDRKDNSVLFWKSMPISEMQNTLTKFSTGIFILPTIAVLAGLLVGLAFTMLSMIYVASYSSSTTPWELLAGINLFSFAIQHWITAIGVALWCLPLFAWLIFASAAARRSPFMLALLPPAALIIAEQVVFSSTWIVEAISRRIPGVAIQENGEAGFLLFEKAGLNHIGAFLTNPGLWTGLIIGAGLLYATVWLRNNRYEV